MGSRWGGDQDPAPLRAGARWERDHDRALIASPLLAPLSRLWFRRVPVFYVRSRYPLAQEGERGIATGAGSRSGSLYPWGRDWGEIKIPPPCGRERLYLVCGSGVCQFFMVVRATHLRRRESAGARRGGVKIPLPLPMGRHGGEIKIPLPFGWELCWPLYLVGGSGVCQFFMVGRATHLRGQAGAGARRGRDQDPAPST